MTPKAACARVLKSFFMYKTAYLSVYDKTGIVDFARGLDGLGFEIYASGSTFKLLRESDIEAEEIRYSPPVPVSVLKALSGRAAVLSENGVPRPYVVAANLYPIASIVGQDEFAIGELSNYLDQANASVLRAAARDFENIITLCRPEDYEAALDSLKAAGGLEPENKRQLAAKAWQYLAAYDATVAQYLSETRDLLGEEVVMSLKKVSDLAYGENRHQKAAFYALSGARPRGLNAAKILSGAQFNLNHYLDLDAAFELAAEFEEPVCVIAKHARPAGVCAAAKPAECFRGAFKADPGGAMGGTAAFNRAVDEETAAALKDASIEGVVAPDYSKEALALLRAKEGLRVVALPAPVLSPHEVEIHSVAGGLLIESKDQAVMGADLQCVTRRKPTDEELRSLKLAWKTAKYAKTYAVALALGGTVLAVSAAESSTYDAVLGAVSKLREKHPIFESKAPLVMACDAALPLKTLEAALMAGVSAVIQPGGWREDLACAQFCDLKNAAMLLTGVRHFRH
jgi:phosphoribosylaminoimidazolecarboxamide formyltransferase/IMP cyclohydrolase